MTNKLREWIDTVAMLGESRIIEDSSDYLKNRAAFSNSPTTQHIQALISKRLGGKAKFGFFTTNSFAHRDGEAWWIVLATDRRNIPKIQRSIQQLAREVDLNMYFCAGDKGLSSISPHGKPLLNDMKSFLRIDDTDPNIECASIFVTPHEESSRSFQYLYHVSTSMDVATMGIHPQPNLKHEDRVYLWTNLPDAEGFAVSGHQRDNNRYVLLVNYKGQLFRDHEEQKTSVYAKGVIPPESLDLVEIIKFDKTWQQEIVDQTAFMAGGGRDWSRS